MKRFLILCWCALVFVGVALLIAAALPDSHDSQNHHPITVIERKVDRIKAKQSAQIAADRHTLHQLTRAMELLP